MPFQIDQSHSEIQFSARHMMVSKVRGVFDKWDGTIALDPANPAKTTVDITIDAASINTKDAQRDGHLTLAGFLECGEVPFRHLQEHQGRGHGRQHRQVDGRPYHRRRHQAGRAGCGIPGQRQEPVGHDELRLQRPHEDQPRGSGSDLATPRWRRAAGWSARRSASTSSWSWSRWPSRRRLRQPPK